MSGHIHSYPGVLAAHRLQGGHPCLQCYFVAGSRWSPQQSSPVTQSKAQGLHSETSGTFSGGQAVSAVLGTELPQLFVWQTCFQSCFLQRGHGGRAERGNHRAGSPPTLALPRRTQALHRVSRATITRLRPRCSHPLCAVLASLRPPPKCPRCIK